MNKRIVLIVSTIFVLFFASLVVIALARGYRVDLLTGTLESTGILVATSDPDGAEVFINGKLTTATNTTLNLPPGTYTIKIAKDGFNEWQKTVTIRKEEVYKTNVFLFPKAPDLRPLTFAGSLGPTVSDDQTKIAYSVASASALTNGLWVLDMSGGRPIVGGGDFRQIYRDSSALPLSGVVTRFVWSSDNSQIIASTSAGIRYLFDTNRINDTPEIVTSTQLDILSAQWALQEKQKLDSQISRLSPLLVATLATASANIRFSPDETKILYTATAAAVLPPILNVYIPGGDPVPETRLLKPGNFYVYDTREDRNYLIAASFQLTPDTISWFPTSRHLVLHDNKEIEITEYDGSNGAVVYAGPFTDDIVYSWPNASRIVISTTLNPAAGIGENLYTINLR